MIELSEIRDAADRLKGRIHKTPLLSSRLLGEEVGVELHLKCENLQKTGSFKPRGALNIVLSLGEQERAAGLITVSAGNHAQAVAWASQSVGAPCVVVMPTDAPKSKIDAVRGYDAEIVFHDDRNTLFDKLHQVEEERGMKFVHPFDDRVGLAGAGTVGLEIVEQFPDVEAVIVPLGGGGLLGGVTCAVKALRPNCLVFAVELEEGPGMQPALQAGKPVPVTRPAKTIADGLTPPFVGALPLEITRKRVDAVVGVSEAAIVEGMKWLLTRAKLYTEGAGAAAIGALMSRAIQLAKNKKVVAIVSGGNVDADRFCSLLTAGT